MSIFDENEVVAGHERLATTVLAQHGALGASLDLIRKGILKSNELPRLDVIDPESWLAATLLVLRIANDAGGSSTLIDRGYFLQAASLMRSIAETAQLLLVFADNPSEIKTWRHLRDKDRYNAFGHGKLERKLSTTELKAKFLWFDTYFDTFSEYGGHPSAVSIIAHHDGDRFHIGPHVNENLYTRSYMDLAVLVWHATDVCGLLWDATMDLPLDQVLPQERKLFLDSWTAIAPD